MASGHLRLAPARWPGGPRESRGPWPPAHRTRRWRDCRSGGGEGCEGDRI